jgi:hypothetical protein
MSWRWLRRLFNDPSDWFGPRLLGIGIEPKTWEGWAITVAVILAMMTISLWFAGYR